MKQKKKKRSWKTVSENAKHSNFYSGMNLYHMITDLKPGLSGQRCYLPDGTMYRKKGVMGSE